ncbi:hypothetical protein [uncultured Jannaschia sp.]|uniref:hypothetical protein n=1 Tax=uncultured Jannaschia sp. TaxID=293347 RepID=UPI002606F537|nr:hypothetical protein [uncultured Jannaschia sp.]
MPATWVLTLSGTLPRFVLPDPDLPPPGDPALVAVLASVLVVLGLVGVVSAWAERRFSWSGFASLLAGATLFIWLWEAERAFDPMSVPEAFIEVLARIVR